MLHISGNMAMCKCMTVPAVTMEMAAVTDKSHSGDGSSHITEHHRDVLLQNLPMRSCSAAEEPG